MPATRTQIYLTADQRKRLDLLSQREGKSLAELIREAVDGYLRELEQPDLDRALRQTFGSAPKLEVPSRAEWDRGYG